MSEKMGFWNFLDSQLARVERNGFGCFLLTIIIITTMAGIIHSVLENTQR